MHLGQKVKNIILANINVFVGCMMSVLLDVENTKKK